MRLFYLIAACPILVIVSVYLFAQDVGDAKTWLAIASGTDLGQKWSDICPEHTVPRDDRGCMVHSGPTDHCPDELPRRPDGCIAYSKRPASIQDCHDMYTYGYRDWTAGSEHTISFQRFAAAQCDLSLGPDWALVCPGPVVTGSHGCKMTPDLGLYCFISTFESDGCIPYIVRPATYEECRDMYDHGYLKWMGDFINPVMSQFSGPVSFGTFASEKCDLP